MQDDNGHKVANMMKNQENYVISSQTCFQNFLLLLLLLLFGAVAMGIMNLI